MNKRKQAVLIGYYLGGEKDRIEKILQLFVSDLFLNTAVRQVGTFLESGGIGEDFVEFKTESGLSFSEHFVKRESKPLFLLDPTDEEGDSEVTDGDYESDTGSYLHTDFHGDGVCDMFDDDIDQATFGGSISDSFNRSNNPDNPIEISDDDDDVEEVVLKKPAKSSLLTEKAYRNSGEPTLYPHRNLAAYARAKRPPSPANDVFSDCWTGSRDMRTGSRDMISNKKLLTSISSPTPIPARHVSSKSKTPSLKFHSPSKSRGSSTPLRSNIRALPSKPVNRKKKVPVRQPVHPSGNHMKSTKVFNSKTLKPSHNRHSINSVRNKSKLRLPTRSTANVKIKLESDIDSTQQDAVRRSVHDPDVKMGLKTDVSLGKSPLHPHDNPDNLSVETRSSSESLNFDDMDESEDFDAAWKRSAMSPGICGQNIGGVDKGGIDLEEGSLSSPKDTSSVSEVKGPGLQLGLAQSMEIKGSGGGQSEHLTLEKTSMSTHQESSDGTLVAVASGPLLALEKHSLSTQRESSGVTRGDVFSTRPLHIKTGSVSTDKDRRGGAAGVVLGSTGLIMKDSSLSNDHDDTIGNTGGVFSTGPVPMNPQEGSRASSSNLTFKKLVNKPAVVKAVKPVNLKLPLSPAQDDRMRDLVFIRFYNNYLNVNGASDMISTDLVEAYIKSRDNDEEKTQNMLMGLRKSIHSSVHVSQLWRVIWGRMIRVKPSFKITCIDETGIYLCICVCYIYIY